MENAPTDVRVRAMLAALLGSEWESLEGEVAFERAPIDSWVLAAETMLAAADGVDPIRVAIKGIASGDGSAGATDSAAMPSRSA